MNTPEMRTERLILRRFTPADLPAMHALLADRRTNRFLPWSYSRYTFDSERILRNRFMLRYNDPCGYYYAVCLKDDNIPIGYISVSGDESHELCFRPETRYARKRLHDRSREGCSRRREG